MTDDIVIRARKLGKKYRVPHRRESYTALRDVIANRARDLGRTLLGNRGHRKRPSDEFWALRDATFDVARGEVVGIVGRNGAGKSTLLKILSRITEPTEGRVELHGRVASLLEVGTGFHPELTGRENIFLNGAILGMTRSEVKRKFDEIVEFASVERFLDAPIKRYSSGMYVRLAFAVAAHLEPEILIVDEVLAVGDHEFQQKCLGRMKEVSASGRTILFVSHNLGALLATCTTGLMLNGGTITARGSMSDIAQAYRGTAFSGSSLDARAFHGDLRTVNFESIFINGAPAQGYVSVSPHVPLKITIHGRCNEPIQRYQFYCAMLKDDVRVFTTHHDPVALKIGFFQNHVALPARFLRPGIYAIAFGAAKTETGEWSWGGDLLRVEVSEDWNENYCPEDEGLINLRGSHCWLEPQ